MKDHINLLSMHLKTVPTIQDIIDKAKLYKEQGLDQNAAIRQAIAAITRPDIQRRVKTLV